MAGTKTKKIIWRCKSKVATGPIHIVHAGVMDSVTHSGPFLGCKDCDAAGTSRCQGAVRGEERQVPYKRGAVRQYTTLGERIVKLAGGRQKPIAKALGVSQQTVSKKMRGECAIIVSDLEKLSVVFRVGMDYWFPGEEGMAKPDPVLAAAIEILRKHAWNRDATVMLASLPFTETEMARKMMVILSGKDGV